MSHEDADMMEDTMTRTDVTLGVCLGAGPNRRLVGRTDLQVGDASAHGDFVKEARDAVRRLAGGPVNPEALYGAFLELWSSMSQGQASTEMSYGDEVTITIDRSTTS